MTNLATVTPDTRRRSGLRIILEHLEDARPDDHALALAHLANLDVSATDLARALTGDAQDDNLNARVTEKAIRDWREKANA